MQIPAEANADGADEVAVLADDPEGAGEAGRVRGRLEDEVGGMGTDQAEAEQRALARFDEVALRYKNWESSVDKIDPRSRDRAP